MAARYGGQFYSAYTEQQYTVFILDEDYTGDITVIDLQDVTVSYPQGDGNRFDTILSARASAKIIINNSGLVTFVEDLAGAREGRFLVQLWKGIAPVFIGYILPDLATEEDVPTEIGGILDLQATDGLARLKTIDYNNNGLPYDGQDTFIAHALKCLNKLTTISGFYPSGNYILKTLVNWHSNKYTYSSGIDPLLQARTPHRAFFSIDNKGNYKYRSCFEVLQEICKAWGCRMFYADYAFWIVQVNEMSSDAIKTAFVYTKTGTQSTESIDLRKDHDQNNPTELIRIAGGVFRFLPPLMKVQVDYQHIATRNLLAGQVLSSVSSTDINAGPVDDQNQDGNMVISFRMQHRIDNYNTPPGDVPVWLLFLVKVQVGDLYLSRLATISGGGVTYGGATWINNSSARYRIALLNYGGGFDVYDNILFYTGSLLASGDFIFGISLGGQFLEDGTEILTGGGAGDIVWNADELNATHLYTGTISGQADIRRFVAVNDTPNNSAMIELTTIIGDGIGTNSPGHIEVQNDADEWVLSDGWRVGNSGSYVAFSALLAQDIIRGQLTPVRRFQGRYNNYGTSIYSMLNSVKRSDGIMLPAGGTFSPAIDDINGEWFFNTPAASGWTLEPYVDIAPDSGTGGGNTGGGSGGGSTGGTTPPVRIYKQAFTGSTSDTVTVTVNGGILPANEAGILIFLNQGALMGDAYTINGADIELTFNLDASDTLTVIFFIQ
jgi:hypothetical protein